MEIGRGLRHRRRDGAVVVVHDGLVARERVAVHRMAQLVRQCAQAENVVGVAHEDVGRLAPHHARGRRALALFNIRRPIHPALLQAAAPQCRHVLRTQGLQGVADPIHRLAIRDLWRVLRDGRLDIERRDLLQPQQFRFHFPVAMPDRQVGFEDLDQIVKNLRGQVIWRQPHFQYRVVAAHLTQELLLFDIGQVQRRQRLLHVEIAIVEMRPGSAPPLPVRGLRRSQQGGLEHGMRCARGIHRVLELEIAVGQFAVGAIDHIEGLVRHAQHFFDFRGERMLLQTQQVGDVVVVFL